MSDLRERLAEGYCKSMHGGHASGPACDDGRRVVRAMLLAADPALARAAEFGLAWEAAEAALPEDWELRLTVDDDRRGDHYTASAAYRYSLGHYRAHVGRARYTPFEMAHGPTPTAALLALAARLREGA